MKHLTFGLMTFLLLISTLIFTGCEQPDTQQTQMSLTGGILFANNPPSLQNHPNQPVPNPKANPNPNQKWQQMVSTDPNSLQKGTSPNNNGNSIKVVAFTPQGDTQDISNSDEISITFSEPVAKLQRNEKNSPSLIEITPALKGEGFWKSSTTYCYKVNQPRQMSSQYNVFFKGTTSINGKPIPQTKWTFFTPTISIVQSTPRDKDNGNTLNQKLIVQLSQDVNPEAIAKFVSIKTPKSFPPFSITYSTDKEREALSRDAAEDKNTKRYITITPSTPYPIASDIIVRFKPGFPSMEGNIGLRKELAISFRTYEYFTLKEIPKTLSRRDGLELVFSNPVFGLQLTDKISITPSVQLSKGRDYDSTYCSIDGNFAYGTSYTITIPADLQDKFGNKLGTAKTFTVKCPDLTPMFNPPPDFFVLEDYIDSKIPVMSGNVLSTPVGYKELDIKDFKALYDYNLEQNRSASFNPRKYPKEELNHFEWKLPVKRNRIFRSGFDIKDINLNKQGFYYINFGDTTDEYYNGSIFQLTDVALVAKFSPTQIFLAPFNMKTGQMIPNLNFKIEEFRDKGTSLGTVKGNNGGIALFEPGESIARKHFLTECYVFSEPHKSFIWGGKEDITDRWSPLDNGWASDLKVFTFTDKYLYKGGQTVHVKGIIREIYAGIMRLPSIKSINAEVFDSRNQSIQKINIPVDNVASTGSFSTEFTLPTNAPSGFYRVNFAIEPLNENDRKTDSLLEFSVQEYKSSKFQVNLAFNTDTLIAGNELSGTLSARYLFGTPMKNGEGKCTWTTEATYFTPAGWEAYSFGVIESEEEQIINEEEFELNDEGRFEFQKDALAPEGKNSVILTVHGEVKDKDNNRIGTSKSITLHRGEYYIGVKTDPDFFTQGKPGKIQLVTVNPDGSLHKNAKNKIVVNITRTEWHSVQELDASNTLRWESTEEIVDVLNESVPVPNGTFEKEYKFNEPGYYNVEVTGEDSLGNTITSKEHFYVTGTGHVSWGVDEGRIIDIVTDKKEYKDGENIQLLIKSPLQNSTALITVEREKVLWSKVVHLNGNANSVQIPVQKDFIPNIYVNVIILKEKTDTKLDATGVDRGKPEFFLGYTPLTIDSSSNKLNISVTANQKTYEPGEEVKLDFDVKDFKGIGAKSELCISVVDKGVLNLVNYQLPNPFDFFWANRPLRVKTVSTFADVLGLRRFGEKDENPGGDGSGSAYGSVVVRKNFKESVYYTASIVTDEKGKAHISFKLPDNLTTFKIMVVAANVSNQFGYGDKEIIVKKALIMKPATPDFVRLLDKFSAGVTVTNTTEEKLTVSVLLKSENIQREKGDPDEKKITLAPGDTLPVLYKFNVTSTATAKLTFKAISGKYSDGLLEEIPVRVPLFTEAAANFGRVENAPVKEQIVVPTETFRDLDKAEITLASSAMVGVKRNFQILQEYPYDCLEQQISKIYPLISAGDFLLNYKLIDFNKQEMDKRIEGILKRMPNYQEEGGFKYYSDSSYVGEYLTCYATEFLLDARAKGFKINNKMLKDAKEYLKKIARMSIDSRYPYSKNSQLLLQAYAVYVLAKDNTLLKDVVNNLYEARERIPFTGLAYLIKTLGTKNNLPAHMQPILSKTILNGLKDQPTMAHFENPEDSSYYWVHETNVRATANILEAFLNVYGKFPQAERIARWLTNSCNQPNLGLSTQDHICVFRAFQKYYQVFESEIPNFVSEVLFNGVSKAKESFSDRELTARTHEIKLSEYKPNSDIDALIKKEGTGMLYYLLRLKYYPSGPVEAMDRGFKVDKVYKTMDGKVVADNALKSGEKYLVEITVDNKMEGAFVMMDDPVPAGLKVVNPNFVTGSDVDAQKTTSEDWWNAYWGEFYRSEIYFDRVLVFADYLKPGKHVWKYLVIATNEGTYTVPSTLVSEMYNPETFGRTSNRNVMVK